MYVVWLLVFWRNVLNVSNFYIKCKSILNKGGLFPLCVFLLILQNDYVIRCRIIVRVHFYEAVIKLSVVTHDCWPDKSISSVRSFTCCAEEGGWWEIIALPVSTGRPALFITWRWGRGVDATCWRIIQSPFTLLTYSGSVSTHFTTILTIATRGGNATPALSPSAVPSAGSASTPSSPRFHDGTNRCCSFQLP